MEHGRDHDQRTFHHLGRTTRRKGEHVIDEEELLPPREEAPAVKLEPLHEGSD